MYHVDADVARGAPNDRRNDLRAGDGVGRAEAGDLVRRVQGREMLEMLHRKTKNV